VALSGEFVLCLTTMKIGILQADAVLPRYQTQFGDYPDMFRALLGRVAPTLGFAVYDVQHGHYPSHIDACDAYLITGSKASVYDPLPWIQALQDYVVRLHQAEKKLIAVCFGHQLVAQALGGCTERSTKGWGVGVHSILVQQQADWMQPGLTTYNIVASHQDQVTRLPPEATLIAGSDFCPNGMFQIGHHIITIQGHPEFSKDYAKAMLQNRREKIGPDKFEQAIQSWNKPLDAATIAAWFVEFIQTDNKAA